MADLSYYAAKIAECMRLLESSNDPLYRDVYQAMANEFAEKHAILARRAAQGGASAGPGVPPSPLLSRVAPPREPALPVKAAAPARRAAPRRATATADEGDGQHPPA